MGDAAGVDAGLTFVWVTAGDVTTVVDVEVDVEGLGEFGLPVDELGCDLEPREPVLILEGAARFAKSAGDIRLIVAQYSCAPFWSDPPGTRNS